MLAQLIAPTVSAVMGAALAAFTAGPTAATTPIHPLTGGVAAEAPPPPQLPCDCPPFWGQRKQNCNCNALITFANPKRGACTPMPQCHPQPEATCQLLWKVVWGGAGACANAPNDSGILVAECSTGTMTSTTATATCPGGGGGGITFTLNCHPCQS